MEGFQRNQYEETVNVVLQDNERRIKIRNNKI